jgi:aspartate carbamoyltransferase catalytic subunit
MTAPSPPVFSQRHLLGVEHLSREEIVALLDLADEAVTISRQVEKKRATLRGRTQINLFFEASTRTRSSFELAGKRLGADVVNVSVSTSSVTKGETLLDTVRNLEAMHAEVIVLRHPASGASHFVAARTGASVVNAGDGAHEHPTQALLDALTIQNHKGKVAGLIVTICGDILHSRVARSNARLLGKMGAEVRLVGPRAMMPVAPDALGSTVRPFERLEDAVRGADVVMMLRIQSERLAGAMMATTREYSRHFGLHPRVLALAKPDAIVMHPGPVQRGVELDPSIADGPRSVILDQVEAGVAVRMAALMLVVGARDARSVSSPVKAAS